MPLTGRKWALVAGGIVLASAGIAYLVLRSSGDDEGDLNDVTDTSDDPTVPAAPAQAAADAGVSLPVYCLARATASEEGGEPRLFQQAVACAIVNLARADFPELGDEDAVVRTVLGTAGAFGRQGTGGRKISSRNAPASSQLALAADVLAGRVADPTGGATQFDSPSGQRWALANDPLTKKTPEQIADQRTAAGYELVVVAGIDPDRLRFWRRA
jgi:hypothetical protein